LATAIPKPGRQRKKRATNGKKTRARAIVARTIRTDFGLSMPTFSTMVGVPAEDLTRWEADGGVLNAASAARVERVSGIRTRLAGIMRQTFIPTWLEQPNDACKDIGVRAPLDLFENGDYETIEGMIWYVESGIPG
jgi:DNA-binding transcriptional regulator YiaG